MEVFNELIESEVSIIIPHVADIIGFCLEVRAAVPPPPPPRFDWQSRCKLSIDSIIDSLLDTINLLQYN